MADAPAAGIVHVETSAAALGEDNPVRRLPRSPWRPRPLAFWSAFEDRMLWYDCFRDCDGDRVLLVGPAPLNLEQGLRAARYSAAGAALAAEFFPSRSTMITALAGVSRDAVAVTVDAFGEQFTLPIQPSQADRFAGTRLLFAINKDNRLDWIVDWADWHATLHGTDAVVLFDNGSTLYAPAHIEAALASVPGLKHIAVVPVPHTFGPIDKSVLMTRFYPRFLQISVTQIALRRFGMRATGLLNCDIDELAWSAGASLYDRARASDLGALRLRGRWIEAVRDGSGPARHRDFASRYRDARHKLSPSKWVLDPSRDWVQSLAVQPYLHRIHGAPDAARRHDAEALFFHFRGVNTDWKENRTGNTAIPREKLVNDAALALASATYAARRQGPSPHA